MIYPVQIYVYFVMFIFVFIFEEYMPVVFIYWCWKYHTNNWGNVSVGGFLCARECTFCNVYICIGCMLPTFGGNMSIGGFLCALWGEGLGNVHVVMYVLDERGHRVGDICQ